jgi:CubicO group peptidase (beta-lactamase class C family)
MSWAPAYGHKRMTRMDDVMAAHIDKDSATGVAWLTIKHGQTTTGAKGVFSTDEVVRISSMTKPVTAVAALILIEECRLRLDEPVDDLLPELANRRVLAKPTGPIEETVPANRPITVRDVLTFTLGLGMDFDFSQPQPVLHAMGELALGAGPPQPQEQPDPDEWMRRLGTLPLARQPGERWLYNTGSDVLGVLIARAAGQPLDAFLNERVFAPLGMVDTGFHVPDDPATRARFHPCYWLDPATGERTVFDPVDGQWARPPAFPLGGSGLVSTLADFASFATALMNGGAPLLSRPTVEAMTTNQLEPHMGGPAGGQGWGFGVGVQLRRTGLARSPGSYGWDGGLGTSWANDPAEGLIAIVLTDQLFTGPFPPPAIIQDFWTCAYTEV